MFDDICQNQIALYADFFIPGIFFMSLKSHQATALAGNIVVPGDKSISHRALMFGAIAVGETLISGLLEGEDVLATAQAMRALGADVEKTGAGEWRVSGRGIGGLVEPETVLDMGNSGTAARLLIGLLSTHPLKATFCGDDSLSKRPMERVMAPLRLMGGQFESRSGGRLPLTVIGSETPLPIEYELPVASAQVKSAILLAGLNTAGETTVIEPKATRDHSEKMLTHFGAEVRVEKTGEHSRRITIVGQPELVGREIIVPADISSAAFPVVAALLVPGSDVTIANVGMNPLRTGLIETLVEMGGKIELVNAREVGGEPVADLRVQASKLRGISVPASRAPSMIDEYPVLFVAASCASGTTYMPGLDELRVKESDRLASMAKGLEAAGVDLVETEDSLTIEGSGLPPLGGVQVDAELDHRIAMAFLVLGMVSAKPVSIEDARSIDTSFPGFSNLMNGLGGNIVIGNFNNPGESL